jgi:hypothetical protein
MELSTTASNFEPIILTPVQAFAIINQPKHRAGRRDAVEPERT